MKWLAENIRKALDLEFVEDVLVQNYVDLNQRTTEKGKGIAEKRADLANDKSSSDNDDDDNDDATFDEARRRSLMENYDVEGEPSRDAITADDEATATEPTTTEVLEQPDEELVDFEPSPKHFEVPMIHPSMW